MCAVLCCAVCRDVRTREAGIQDIHHQVQPDEVELIRRDYSANGGWETFLAYEDPRQVCAGSSDYRVCDGHVYAVRHFVVVVSDT